MIFASLSSGRQALYQVAAIMTSFRVSHVFFYPDNARGYSKYVNNDHFGRDSANFVYNRIFKMASYGGKEKTELGHKKSLGSYSIV